MITSEMTLFTNLDHASPQAPQSKKIEGLFLCSVPLSSYMIYVSLEEFRGEVVLLYPVLHDP